MERISKEDFYFELAKAHAKRATCLRRKVGVVIIRDGNEISGGYCGAPRGKPNCTDLGVCIREQKNSPLGSGYDDCRSVHAEVNAIINASLKNASVSQGDLYLYCEDAKTGEIIERGPCKLCKPILINARINNVYFKTKNGYNSIRVQDWIDEKE